MYQVGKLEEAVLIIEEKRKRKVIGWGLNVRGVSELQIVLGTSWAGLIRLKIVFSDKLDRTSSSASSCRATASGNRPRA